MSKANHDRNIIKIGTTKKDDKEWDRLEDRLQTDPNLGGGGPAELIVPGTYVPKVGLPPGIPYIYVIGNLMEGYPIDLNLTGGPLTPEVELSLDFGDELGLGLHAILGKTFGDDVAAYRIPAAPAIIPGHYSGTDGGNLRSILSADGTLFEMPYSEAVTGYSDFQKSRYIIIKGDDDVWYPREIYEYLGIFPIFAGQAADVDAPIIMSSYTSTTPDGVGGSYDQHTIVAMNKYAVAIDTQYETVRRALGDSAANAGISENGWMLIAAVADAEYPGSPASGTFWARPAVVTAGNDIERIGKVLVYPSSQIMSERNMSVGPTGIAWVSYQLDASGNDQTVVRLDLINKTLQRYLGTLYDSTATYPIEIRDTIYIDDNTCAVSGHYTDTVLGTQIPTVSYIALDYLGNVSVNILEFPDYAGADSSIFNMVKTPTELVYHLYSSALDSTGFSANILWGTTLP